MSGHERTGWRDEGLSRRHRQWGFNCPAVDLDFLMVEYDQSEAVALIEYKNEHALPVEPGSPSIVALRRMADRAELYAFVVRYADDFYWFKVQPLNYKAHALGRGREILSEGGYVAFLHELRGRPVPESWRQKLSREMAEQIPVEDTAEPFIERGLYDWYEREFRSLDI